jgi:adenosylcobinamide kinase/adenosylcobinamide-phosphate guanylyltransferase
MKKSRKPKNRIIFIIGGARSGKSSFAQQLATKKSEKVVFVATAEPLDSEMTDRIKKHKKSRPKSWQTLELHREIAKGLKPGKSKPDVVIIDCITLLISNLTQDKNPGMKIEKMVFAEINELIDYMKTQSTTFIIVSNELGLGVVPDNRLARDFRDIQGKVNQLIAQNADEIYFMMAGIPLRINS